MASNQYMIDSVLRSGSIRYPASTAQTATQQAVNACCIRCRRTYLIVSIAHGNDHLCFPCVDQLLTARHTPQMQPPAQPQVAGWSPQQQLIPQNAQPTSASFQFPQYPQPQPQQPAQPNFNLFSNAWTQQFQQNR